MPYETNLGRVVGTMIYSGTATTSEAIIQDLHNRQVNILDGDMYFSIGTEIVIWQYSEAEELFVKLVSIWDDSRVEVLIKNLTSKYQSTLSLIKNTTENINGKQLSNFSVQEITIEEQTVLQVLKNNEICSKDDASEYLEYMTGSKFVPEYNEDHPRNSYFMSPSGEVLKPQWDETNGLLLFNAIDLSTKNYVDNAASQVLTALNNHKDNKNNPHEVTKEQVGLGNVDNTSDADKPVSTAQQQALDQKVSKTELFQDGKVKKELIPDDFDEVMEFEKEVNGANFIADTLETEIGSVVWCAAAKATAGDTYYRKFIVNNDGTEAGLTTIDPAKGKLYVGKARNNLYGWSGSNLIEISKSLALGETSTTAYAGNKGKANADAIAAIQAALPNYAEKSSCSLVYSAQSIEDLPQSLLDSLKIGDVVRVGVGGFYYQYVVNMVSNDAIYLARFTKNLINQVHYSKPGNQWIYLSSETTDLDNILRRYSFCDIEEMYEFNNWEEVRNGDIFEVENDYSDSYKAYIFLDLVQEMRISTYILQSYDERILLTHDAAHDTWSYEIVKTDGRLMLAVTYEELKRLRDNSQLIPGMQYRIINFVTDVGLDSESGHIQSAKHPFDIIVIADSVNHLNEKARAAFNSNDKNYFRKYNVISADWKPDVTVDDVEVCYFFNSSQESTYEAHESSKVITQLTKKENQQGLLVPAMFNPDPNEDGNDCYYIYQGTFSISRTVNTLLSIQYVVNSNGEEVYEGDAGSHEGDVFVELGYRDGIPAIFKNDLSDPELVEEGTDYNDVFKYVGDMEVDGINYNKWEKYESGHSTGYFILTQVVVVNNQFTITQWELENSIVTETVTYDRWIEWYTDSSTHPGFHEGFEHLTNQLVDVVYEEESVDIEAWELKYCLDNDYRRFRWAPMEYAVYGGEPYIYQQTIEVDGITYYQFIRAHDAGEVVYSTVRYPEIGDDLYIQVDEQIVLDDQWTGSYHYEGKGVIYYMKDEWGNEAPYDFKNIQFGRWKYHSNKQVFNNLEEDYYAPSTTLTFSGDLSIPNAGDIKFFYTFSALDEEGKVSDSSINKGQYARDNVIKARAGVPDDIYIRVLPNIVLIGECSGNIFESDCDDITILQGYRNIFGEDVCRVVIANSGGNSLANDCYDIVLNYLASENTIGKECHDIIGSRCNRNILETGCNTIKFYGDATNGPVDDNRLGIECSWITIQGGGTLNIFESRCQTINLSGHICSYNYFGELCYSINLTGNRVQRNRIGSECHNLTFGDTSEHHIVGMYSYNIEFKANTHWFTIGKECHHITMNAASGRNTIMDHCNNLTFAAYVEYCLVESGCENVNISANHCINCVIEEGTKYFELACSTSGGNNNKVKNVRVHSGIYGDANNFKVVDVPRETDYQYNIVLAGTTTVEV